MLRKNWLLRASNILIRNSFDVSNFAFEHNNHNNNKMGSDTESKIILLVSGWKGSGKDILSEYLVKKYNFTQMSYASALKDQVAVRYSIDRHHLDSQEHKELPLKDYPVDLDHPIIKYTFDDLVTHYRVMNGKLCHTPRSILILEGTYMARVIDSQIWIKTMIRNIEKSNCNRIVISDTRFVNEIELIRSKLPDFKVLTLRVNRHDFTDSVDITERGLDNYVFDHIINNKGTLEQYYNNIESFISKLLN
jgi:hypothetical protein